MQNELERRREELEIAERNRSQPSGPVKQFDIRQVEMIQQDTGNNQCGDRLQAAIYRITEQQSISFREEEDSELMHIRSLLLANQLDRLQEPYRPYKNTQFTRHGFIFQDEKIVVPKDCKWQR